MSTFKINTFPEQFRIRNQETNDLKNPIIRPLQLTLLSYTSRHKRSDIVMVSSRTC